MPCEEDAGDPFSYTEVSPFSAGKYSVAEYMFFHDYRIKLNNIIIIYFIASNIQIIFNSYTIYMANYIAKMLKLLFIYS